MKLWSILYAVVSDRTIQAGSTTSGLTLWGGHHLPRQEALAYYATAAGGVLTTLLIVYTVLKIVRLWNNPKSVE